MRLFTHKNTTKSRSAYLTFNGIKGINAIYYLLFLSLDERLFINLSIELSFTL